MSRFTYPTVIVCAIGVFGAANAWSTPFAINAGQTVSTAQTLTDTETATVKAGGALSLPQDDDDVAITVSGNTRIDNAGTIRTLGGGRGIRNSGGDLSLTVVNESGALLQTADKDAIQLHKGNNVTFDNSGTVDSLNKSQGGAQAIDFNHITQGRNTVNNFAGATIKAFEADGVRPGVNGRVVNEGTILSTNAPRSTSGSAGVDAQSNSGVVDVNHPSPTAATSLIEGARHGITGGNTDTSTNGDFALDVTNNAGGTIRGEDGSGINIDGFNGNERVTVNNGGRIAGNGVAGDGDGVDVDGLVDLNNTGTIRSLGAASGETSEGVTVGGGNIVNSGTIEGDNTRGGASRGITLAGLDKNPDSGNPIPTQGIFADSAVTNSGLIKGRTGSAIAVSGAGNAHTVTITNETGGMIEGGGSAPAVFTGANNASITDFGTITADGSGQAVDLGSGDSTLDIRGASAAINGDISGGTGLSTLDIAPGAGNEFAYNDDISNFSQVSTGAGTTTLNGQNSAKGTTQVHAGTLVVGSQTGSDAHLTSAVDVAGGATLAGNGTVGATTVASNGVLAAGNDGAGILTVNGTLDLNGTLSAEIANANTFDILNVNGIAAFGPNSALALNVFDNARLQTGDSFDVLTAQSFRNFAQLGLQGSGLANGLTFDAANVALAGSGNRALRLTVSSAPTYPAPAPGSPGLLAIGISLIAFGRRYRDRLANQT